MHAEFFFPHTLKYEFENILDIGPGNQTFATDLWLKDDRKVTSIDIADYRELDHPNHEFILGDFMNHDFGERKFDAIIASHVLEHFPNPNIFLKKIRSLLKEDGIFFVVVPPLKHNIVGGHVTLWNMGLLMYQLVLAQFNVRDGRFIKQDYNIAGIVRRSEIELPELINDNGDLETLAEFFPNKTDFLQGFDGNMEKWNWFE